MPFPVSGTLTPSATAAAPPSSGTALPTVGAPVMVGTDVGSAPPPFTMRLSDGSAVASEALVAAGRPVFMMYFATW